MRRSISALAILLVACEAPTTQPRLSSSDRPALSASGATCTLANGNVVPRGFDEFGYNRCARQFVGRADGVDKSLDGTVWGDPTFANDHLVMKWNAEWDRGNAEKWTKPPYDAWLDNEWNGVRADGSGYTEHFKTKWSADCAANVAPAAGTYCIWDQFLVLMDQGIAPGDGHEWWAKAIPGGFGN